MDLPNGCRCSELSVHPKNWETKKASTKKAWYIHYRFYDPNFKEKHPGGLQKIIKRMNTYTQLADRQVVTRQLLTTLEQILKTGYNPITGEITPAARVEEGGDDGQIPIEATANIIDAMRAAVKKKDVVKNTKDDLDRIVEITAIAFKNLGYSRLAVCQVSRRHLKAALEEIGIIKRRAAAYEAKQNKTEYIDPWTANNYNFHRAYLGMIFKELEQWEAVENNPIDKKFDKKKTTKKLRVTLTTEQRITIDRELRLTNYPLWRIMRIFFRSGARIVELVAIKTTDVNLDAKTVKYLVKKDKEYREVERVITEDVLPLWQEVCKEAKPGQYLFSTNRLPGNVYVHPKQVGKRWKKWVKDKYNVEADFYSLKHTNSTETKAKIGAHLAALHNQHTEEILNSAYDVEGDERDKYILRHLTNDFAPRSASK